MLNKLLSLVAADSADDFGLRIDAPVVMTREQFIDSVVERNRVLGAQMPTREQLIAQIGPMYFDIRVEFTVWCGSDEMQVMIDLQDIGDGESYDMSLETYNGDWAGPVTLLQAQILALSKFIEAGLHERFQLVGGHELTL